ncbi:hypothetical protein FOA52_000911 [Chlamydomonas sp. UWO 241]|nr:hypothetical protein FOA52_000911 [Chlamydomonas sp. UWO 241]
MRDADGHSMGKQMAKYWLQRYSLFSRYDDGIEMDIEGWYSVTPEVLAHHQAGIMREYGRGLVAADAMSGCGGNVIAMAATFPQVIGIEISPTRCAMMAHNAALYAASPRVNYVVADFFAAAPTLLADAIFCSPPWGGPTYQYCETFDVLAPSIGGERSVADLLAVCLSVVTRTWGMQEAAAGGSGGRGVVALFLPRNTDLVQLEALVPPGAVWQLERSFVNGRLKGVTLYAFGGGPRGAVMPTA